jgi:competence ComEA-like helix-hairpin-helix protein
MKKSVIVTLLTITLIFSAFVCGFYTGRNFRKESIHISNLLLETNTTVKHTSTGTTVDPTTTARPNPTTSVIPGSTPASSTDPEASTPTEPNVTDPTDPPKTKPTKPGRININKATKAELETLPGIGPKLAQAIIDYRNEFGPFDSPKDLLNVSGIGEKRLDAILDYITTGG